MELQPRLAKSVEEALKEQSPDNPVYRAAKSKVMREVAGKGDPQQFLLDRLDRLDSMVTRIASDRPLRGAYYPGESSDDRPRYSLEMLVTGKKSDVSDAVSKLCVGFADGSVRWDYRAGRAKVLWYSRHANPMEAVQKLFKAHKCNIVRLARSIHPEPNPT
jgi:hypothetical protein